MSMEIDLRKTKTICISLKKSDRRSSVSSVLNDLGYERWTFFDAKTGIDAIEGCALSHIEVLSNHDFKEPLLLIEDDISDSAYYNPIVTCPEDTDAVYIGYSWWAWDSGRAKQSTLEKQTYAIYENGLFRINNMLSTHAILYVSKNYATAAVEKMTSYLKEETGNRHCDVALAKIQKDYKVYATPKHLFFQMCPKNTMWTNRGLDEKTYICIQGLSNSLIELV